jgi:hypothetical protein
MLYGSFRVWIKSTNIPGTVAAFFLFSNESEIDIELLSAIEPPQTYFAIHPGIIDPSSGRASALTHTNYMMAYPPSQVNNRINAKGGRESPRSTSTNSTSVLH